MYKLDQANPRLALPVPVNDRAAPDDDDSPFFVTGAFESGRSMRASGLQLVRVPGQDPRHHHNSAGG